MTTKKTTVKASTKTSTQKEPVERKAFAFRVIDNGDGTGALEAQLDGSGIFKCEGTIRKEAFYKVGD